MKTTALNSDVSVASVAPAASQTLKKGIIAKDFQKNKYKYLMMLPVILFYLIFFYRPIYMIIIAFQNYSPAKGISGSTWVGLKHFKDFIFGIYFQRTFINTILISLYEIVFGFPFPIILALLLNEVRNNAYKNMVQTIVYLPHFISSVVICGIIKDFCLTDGLINHIIEAFGGVRSSLLQRPELFKTIFVSTNIWQTVGWNSIVYLAALASINTEMYEAAIIDGATRMKQIIYITLPSIMPTIVTILILKIGRILGVGFEKIILLYNPSTYQTADVISSFVYRKGLIENNLSFSTAVGLFESIINLGFLISANWLSKKYSETSLW